MATNSDLAPALELAGLEVDDLEISTFLDDSLVQQSETVAKVMAASCTTCECCCSCVLLTKDARPLAKTLASVEAHFSTDELAFIKSRDPKYRDPQRYAESEWPVLLREVAAEMEKGTDPTTPQVQALARRWSELVQMFTGGHAGVEKSLHEMYKKTPHPAHELGPVPDQKTLQFMASAMRPIGGS